MNLDLVKGLARGLTADVAGAPVDLMSQIANLGLAAGGYVGHKTGLLKEPFPLIQQPIGGSDWFAKNTVLQDPGSAAYTAGRLTGNVAPLFPKIAAAIPQQKQGQLNTLIDAFDAEKGIGAVPFNADIDYFGFSKTMTASEFLKLAAKTDLSKKTVKGLAEQLAAGKKFGNPFLNVEWNPSTKTFQVIGHEGRHRSQALLEQFGPDAEMPVHIFPAGMRARNLTPEMLEAPFLPEKSK